jgi:hypothetical protein
MHVISYINRYIPSDELPHLSCYIQSKRGLIITQIIFKPICVNSYLYIHIDYMYIFCISTCVYTQQIMHITYMNIFIYIHIHMTMILQIFPVTQNQNDYHIFLSKHIFVYSCGFMCIFPYFYLCIYPRYSICK